jgi:ABC-type transport system involved in multi-copper enzyme maturation permease subunit
VSALVRAELLKLRTTRTPVWLLLATLALAALTIGVDVPKVGDETAPVSLDDPILLAVTVGDSFGVPLVLAVLLGVVAVTQEFRYGTITSTYLVEPRRTRVLAAKSVSMALVNVALTGVTLVFSASLSIGLIASRHGQVSLGVRFWQMAAAGLAVMAVYGVIGVAIGALVRNQITAVVAALVWMTAVEHIVIPAYPTVGRWLPAATTYSLMQLGPTLDPDGNLLSASASGLVLAAYAALAVGLAVRFTPKRDVL